MENDNAFHFIAGVKRLHSRRLTGQAAQTAVPQTSVLLHVLQLLHVQTQLHTARTGQ